MLQTIQPRSGVAFELKKGQHLRVIDPLGEQVSDLLAISNADRADMISSGRSIDYAAKLFLTTGDILYSSQSLPMLTIKEDTVGRHDFIFAPCSEETFRIIYGDQNPHRGCLGNLAASLERYAIQKYTIPVCFNIFMNVVIDGASGKLKIEAPLSKAGDYIVFRSEMDLIIGLTACSALQSNNFSLKPIEYIIT